MLKTDFTINQQQAENLGHTEMISGILAGLHYFTKQAKVYFKDLNQKDECIIGDKKAKIYTRDAFSDEDMLIYESYFSKHPEIDLYILCKIKGGKYSYLGYIEKSIADNTRKVQMIGEDSSQASEEIRRIFAEQYKSLSDFIPIEESELQAIVKIEQQKYIPLHMHSEFSVGDAYGKLSYITDQLKNKGFKGAALTDHGTLAGVWEFQKHCLAKDIKPIIGIEAYVKLDLEAPERYHTVILVKNKKGWENLLKLHAVSVRENFYYKPIILYDDLLNNSEGLIITSGCSSSPIPKLLKEGKLQDAESLIDKVKAKLGDDFYIEIQSHEIENNQEIMQTLFILARTKGVKCIFTTDSHYPDKSDKVYHEAVKAIDQKKDYGQAGYGDDCFFLMQHQEIMNKLNKPKTQWMLPHIEEFMNNTMGIYDKCDFKIEPDKKDDTLPKLEFEGKTRKEKLKELCIEGLKKYTKYSYEQQDIKERLDLELDRIISKGYDNYFLIVWDMINWAKEQGIMVGPGRGSVGASLAAYALNITDCDPIEHELLFDRFLSVIRRDMPDVDMDFQDERREEVFEYLKKRYGEKNCAKIATYSRFHPKGVLRDIGRIFNIPGPEINKIASMVIERSGGDARASFSLQDTFSEFDEAKLFQSKYPLASEIAIKLEGAIRHKGVHAAAMVVSENEISTYAPIAKVGGIIVTEWEKQLVEDIKLIKFDILGLKTLSVLQDAARNAGVQLPKDFKDKAVYEKIFKDANTIGIFQLGTTGMQKFSSQLNISEFSDLYDATTLFRPSCLHSGQAMIYANRKLGKEPITYFHKTLEPITNKTKGVILYQEQIMQIMNQVGGMSWATAEMARKVITKSKGKDAFNKMRAEFVANANRIHNMSFEEAEKLYDVVSTFGSYGFNKAHAVEYSIISYWGAWLKLYYPKYFFTSLLKYETEEKEIKDYNLDMEKNNIKIEYPEINKSGMSYSIVDDKIYAGVSSISGIGEKVFETIKIGRPYVNFSDFKKRCKVSEKILKGLVVADAFREFKINKRVVFETGDNETSQTTLFSFDNKNTKKSDFDDIEISKLIYEYTTLTPKIDIKKSFDFGNFDFKNVSELPSLEGGKQYYIRGIITDVLNKDKLLRSDLQKHTHQFDRHMIYLNLNDGTGNIACQVNPETYEKYSKIIEKIKKSAVIVLGTSSKDGRKMYADMIQIVSGEVINNDIDILQRNIENLKPGQAIITSARPAVSKNNKSYYRIVLNNGVQGLCFRFEDKIFPGMKCSYKITQHPFINLNIIG